MAHLCDRAHREFGTRLTSNYWALLSEHEALADSNPELGPDSAKVLLCSPGITSACVENINNFPMQSYIRAPFHWGGDFCLFSGTDFLLMSSVTWRRNVVGVSWSWLYCSCCPSFPTYVQFFVLLALEQSFHLKTQTPTLQILFVMLHSLEKETMWSKSWKHGPPTKCKSK